MVVVVVLAAVNLYLNLRKQPFMGKFPGHNFPAFHPFPETKTTRTLAPKSHTTTPPKPPKPPKPSTPKPTPRPKRIPKVPIDKQLLNAAAQIRFSLVPPVQSFLNDPYFQIARSGQAYYNHFRPKVLISPSKVCSTAKKGSPLQPFLMILVLSSYRCRAKFERLAIRATYGSVAEGNAWPNKEVPESVGLVFLLGKPPTVKARRRLTAESQQYGDVMIGDFTDTYANLTLKVLFGLRWMVEACPHVQYVLKIDDDTFVNIPLLLAFLLQYGEDNAMYGHVYFSSRVFRGGKWAVPNNVYPLGLYPPYLSGTAYVASMDAVKKVVDASVHVPMLPVEDAHVTGILPIVADVRRISTYGFTHVLDHKPDFCEFMLNKRLVGNRMRKKDKIHAWNLMKIADRRHCSMQ